MHAQFGDGLGTRLFKRRASIRERVCAGRQIAGDFRADDFGVLGFGNRGFVFGAMVFRAPNEVSDLSDRGATTI